MAQVIIPPWLNFDPTAAFRLRIQAQANRSRNAEIANQLQIARERNEVTREQIAAQEREQAMRNQLYAETHAHQLAQQGQLLQFRRDEQKRLNEQFLLGLRLRQQAEERKAADAAIQMQGMRGFDAGIQELVNQGVPYDQAYRQLFPKFAPEMLYRSAPALTSAYRGMLANQMTGGGAPGTVTELQLPSGKSTGTFMTTGPRGQAIVRNLNTGEPTIANKINVLKSEIAGLNTAIRQSLTEEEEKPLRVQRQQKFDELHKLGGLSDAKVQSTQGEDEFADVFEDQDSDEE